MRRPSRGGARDFESIARSVVDRYVVVAPIAVDPEALVEVAFEKIAVLSGCVAVGINAVNRVLRALLVAGRGVVVIGEVVARGRYMCKSSVHVAELKLRYRTSGKRCVVTHVKLSKVR